MKSLPVVSIVGRQNVGKSTLFNCFFKKKIAITHDYPGVTRDVLDLEVSGDDFVKPFTLRDTPGLDIENVNDLTTSIIEVSFNHLTESDIIIFVMDKNEITDYDNKLIELLKKDKRFKGKFLIFCVNKSDDDKDDFDLEFYYRMGLQEVIPISAIGRRNLKLLFEKLNFYLKSTRTGILEKTDLSISIVGKPNSGKSSFLNSILGFERAVVSEIAGTTRDSVHSRLKFENKNILIVDTAGIRKQSKNAESIEFFSYKRTLKSLEETDVVIMLIDATKGIGEYDKKIFGLIEKSGRPLILAVNKWDLIPDKDGKSFVEYKKDLISRFFPVASIPVISISATKKQRVRKVIEECIKIHEKLSIKIPTSAMNNKLRDWMQEGKIGIISKKPPKILYGTQISSSPFKLLLFVNHTELFKPSLINYIKKKLVEEYDLQGVPIEIEVRSDRK